MVYYTVYKILNLFLPPCPPAVPDPQHQMVIKTHTGVLPVGKNGEVGSQGEGEVRRRKGVPEKLQGRWGRGKSRGNRSWKRQENMPVERQERGN